MKLGILLFPFMLAAQTATYPGAVVTDTQLKVLKDRAQTTLTSALNASATSISVTSSSKFGANVVITIDSEQISVCAVGSGTMTVGHSSCPNIDGRGFNGTAAASHTNSSVVSAYLVAWHDNAQSAEIKAVEAALGANLANIIALIPNPTPVANGGTNAATAAGARTNLGAAASGANSDITSLSAISTPLTVAEGGTNAGTAAGARSSLGAAASGANSDITSLSNISTPLTVAEGGTNAATAAGARSSLGAAASGANADITSLASLSTPIPTAGGGTGVASPTAHTVAVAEGSSAMAFVGPSTAGRILTSNGASADPSFQDPVAVFPAGSQTQYLRLKPNSGNSTTTEFAALPNLNVADYNYAAQQPGGSIAVGSNSITMTPCPLGFAKATSGTQALTALYISAGSGTAEVVSPTGTSTCTSGAASGTVTFVAANTHSGAWTVTSPSFGLQEAVNVAGAAGGGILRLAAGTYVLRTTVTLLSSNITLQGSGGACCQNGTWISRTGDFGDSIVLGSSALGLVNIGIYDLSISHTINYVSGNPGTLSNKPTSGAHIRAWGTNTLNIARCRFENLVYDIVLTAATATVVRDCQFYGLWNGTSVSTEVTQNQILINQTGSGAGVGIPTYIALINNIHTGPVSTSAYTGASSRRNVEIDACEDCYIDGGSMERGYENNVLFASTTPYVLFNVRLTNVKFDGAGTADVQLQGDGTATITNVTISGNIFNGEQSAPMGLSIPTVSPGAFPVQGAVITGNQFFAHTSTAMSIMDGQGFTISNNNIRYYNYANGFSTAATASGIYFGDRANRAYGTGNIIGGGYFYEDYGSGTGHTKYGLSLASPTGNQATINVGWAPPSAGALSVYVPTIAGSCGSGPAVNALSTSQSGAFTTGTGSPTSCTVTFTVPFTHTPMCVVSAAGGAVTPAITPGSTSLIVTTTTASATYNWSCQ